MVKLEKNMKRLIVTLVSIIFIIRGYAQNYLHVYSKSMPFDTISVDSVSIRYIDNKLYLYRYSQGVVSFWKQLYLQKEDSEYKKLGFFDPIKGCIIIDGKDSISYSYHPRHRKIVKVSKVDKRTWNYLMKQSTTHMSHYDHYSHYSSR